MSYYDDASLVVIPSGYKTSKVYAEKPTDGSGDLAFTRTGDTATRVNSAGLIERVRTNVILQSQTFDNASWLKSLVGGATAPVVTANNTTAPDGTLTADKIVFVAPTSADISQVTQNITLTGIANGSVYLKAFAAGDVGKILAVRFNSGSYALVTLTADWQRFSVSQTAIVGTFDIALRPAVGSSSGTVSVYAWGAQLEAGDVATAYIPTTSAAVTVGPVANVPRLDYTGSTCPRLLLEPQRTNLVTYSEQLDNAAWTKTRSTITANNAVSPDGYTNADRITDTTFTANSSFVERTIGSTIGTAYTYSCFVKAGTAPHVYIGIFDGSNYTAIFNPNTGVNTFTTSGATSAITSYGNGWYRISITRTVGTVTIYPYIGVCQLSNSITYNGTGAYTAQLWGAQLETNFATSYIPTLAASATRGIDDATKTGITSLIGQTEGTLFLDFEGGANDSVNHFMGFSDGTTGNRIVIVRSSSNTLYAQIRVGGVEQAFIQTATLTANTRYKCAIAYKLNDIAFYVNGALVGTDSAATIPATSIFATNTGVSSSFFERAINQTLVFKTRLTNAALAELTAL